MQEKTHPNFIIDNILQYHTVKNKFVDKVMF